MLTLQAHSRATSLLASGARYLIVAVVAALSITCGHSRCCRSGPLQLARSLSAATIRSPELFAVSNRATVPSGSTPSRRVAPWATWAPPAAPQRAHSRHRPTAMNLTTPPRRLEHPVAEPFLSKIRVMSFVFAPKGWALCNGQLLPINQNQALFSLLGTTFAGDGRVNVALPDPRGQRPSRTRSPHSREVSHRVCPPWQRARTWCRGGPRNSELFL
jgi:hypothetical protein